MFRIVLRSGLFSLLILLVSAEQGFGQEVTFVTPEDAGLSAARLGQFERALQEHIDAGEIAGAVTMVARRGKLVHWKAHGLSNIEESLPQSRDDLFRIASMTKIATSVAALMLYEEGRFALYDPISRFIPAFSSMTVAVPSDSGASSTETFTTVPATQPITIRDLMRHTSGITYGGGNRVIDPLYGEAGLRKWEGNLAAFTEKLASLPLAFEPGSDWEYSLSTDVLGHLIEVVSGQSLDAFLSERVFKPLGMDDTGFVVPESKLHRLANVYEFKEGALTLLESSENTPLKNVPPAFSGGGGWAQLGSDGGLVSTSWDFMRLLQMILNGGELDGERLLGRKATELMTMDHLNGISTWLGDGVGFGLGVAVLNDVGAYGELGSPGLVWWAGSDNTYFWIDPVEELIGIFMTQMRPFGHLSLMDRYQLSVYQSIVD